MTGPQPDDTPRYDYGALIIQELADAPKPVKREVLSRLR